ncbi:glycosyltransferase [Neobacillus sp. GCM10023253]|uniref:glycosyltransferase n=1 Tax=Neobacillus sp. GCM10023253 TaxID=3252644 RepID=UPI0036158F65
MYDNLDVLFIGGLFPKEKEKEILQNSIGNVQNAANNLQWSIVDGLDANRTEKVKILNSLYIGSFPKRYKKMYIKTHKFSHTINTFPEDINVGFLNITGVKNLSRYFSLKPYVKNWAQTNNGKKKIVIAYAMTSTFTRLLRYIKTLNSEVKTCLIVPDLPQYMNLTNNSKVYNILKKIEIKSIDLDAKYIDSYVLLTEYMRQALNISSPSVVVEGISTNLFEKISPIPIEEEIKTVLYSGGLIEKYGILDLVSAFKKLKGDKYRLIICGSGEAEDFIRKESRRDKRIVYKGLLKREEVLQLQKSSTVLVNPRPNNEEYTKYSFPSKIMEYMSSGRPVIAYKLDGIPEEYYDYIYPVMETEDGLYNALRDVLSKDKIELNNKGNLAKEFVLTQKNSTKQGEKILKMVNQL